MEYIECKTLVPVTEDEIKKHEEDGGHINYIGHHGVEKDTSITTPLRMVANSATKNGSWDEVHYSGPKKRNIFFFLFEKRKRRKYSILS